jgi:hypothetical protein
MWGQYGFSGRISGRNGAARLQIDVTMRAHEQPPLPIVDKV